MVKRWKLEYMKPGWQQASRHLCLEVLEDVYDKSLHHKEPAKGSGAFQPSQKGVRDWYRKYLLYATTDGPQKKIPNAPMKQR